MKFSTSFLTLAAFFASTTAEPPAALSGVSWGPERIDLFGTTPANGNILHKYYTKYGWEPNVGPGQLEVFSGAQASSPVSVTSWGPNRLDYVFVDVGGRVRHKYWTGSEWGPSDGGFEDLGHGPRKNVVVHSWGENRLDLVGLGKRGHYLHKAWTGNGWYPNVKAWENLGGRFASEPTVVSWAAGRFDIFGITKNGTVAHKFWSGAEWVPAGREWEDLGGVNFTGTPVASSMSTGRVDVWAVANNTGELHHLFFEPFSGAWIGWENLGGKDFANAPQVAHWDSNRIDLLGKQKSGAYVYKYWDGHQWSNWTVKGSPFVSEPVLVTLAANNLNLFGLDKSGKLLLEVWDGSQWLPSPETWYQIGDTVAASVGTKDDIDEKALLRAQRSSPGWFRKSDHLQ